MVEIATFYAHLDQIWKQTAYFSNFEYMNISIIGGGISGLTTAIALHKLGLKCKVYEQAPQLNEVGAGIWMQPNALKVLDWLEIGDLIRNNGVSLDKVEITDRYLKPFKETKSGIVLAGKGNQVVSIHRGRLQKILFDALPADSVHLGAKYQSHSMANEKVLIQFDGSSVETDLLLGADGIHSKVRNQTFSNSALRFSGQTCWRGIADALLPESLQRLGREAWGNNLRFGFSQIAPGKVYWFAVANSKPNQKDHQDDLKDTLAAMFKDFHPIVSEIIANTEVSKIHRSDISDLKRLKKWHTEAVCLIGDAAHATTPNMGQGGGQGIEDAYYLSHFLSRNQDASKAFERFEQSRRKKVDYVVNNSWRFGKMAHHYLGQKVLKTIMKLTPDQVMKKQMNKLYSIQESFD